jgi:hypothetical protein
MTGQEDPSSGRDGELGEAPSNPPFSERFEEEEAMDSLSPLEDFVARRNSRYKCVENDNGDHVWLQTMLKNVKASSDSFLWPAPIWRRKVRSIKVHCQVWDGRETFCPCPATGWRFVYVELALMVVEFEDGPTLVCGRELDGRLPEMWELSLYPLTGLVRVSEHSGGFRHYQVEDSPISLIFDDEEVSSSTSNA